VFDAGHDFPLFIDIGTPPGLGGGCVAEKYSIWDLRSLRNLVLLLSLILLSGLHKVGPQLKNAGLDGLRFAALSLSCGLTLPAPALNFIQTVLCILRIISYC
jgi:hypothetical protein